MYHLLKLWTLKPGQLSVQEIANVFQLSTKQTARKLKKYEQEGYLTYIPGKGRGNKSVIQWHQNVEEIVKRNITNSQFRIHLFKLLDEEKLTDTFFKNIFVSLFSEVNSERQALKIPVYSLELTKTPWEVVDTESAWIMMHLYSRLIGEDRNGELAYHWTQGEDGYVFYLRPSRFWHNGTDITMEQIVESLQKSFYLTDFIYYRKKLNSIRYGENKLTIDYDGTLEELLLLLAQVEFSIYDEELYSGAFMLNQYEKDQYVLTQNSYYVLAKPILSKIVLQKIPTELTRKITWNKEDSWQQQLEYGGKFYLYSKASLPQSIKDFFKHFAQELSYIDELKIAVDLINQCFPTINKDLTVGYLVNKRKYVDLIKQMNQKHLHVTHLVFNDYKNIEQFKEYDCIIIPLDEVENLKKVDNLLSIFSERMALYHSYRKMYYPNYFVRKGPNLYGYPNLKESYLVR